MNSFVLVEAVCWVCGVGANDSTVAFPLFPIVPESSLLVAYHDKSYGCLGLASIALDNIQAEEESFEKL